MKIKDILKLRAWKFYFEKTPFLLLIIFYIIISENIYDKSFVLDFFLLMFSLSLYSWGVLVNDYFDLNADKIAGKNNIIQKIPKKNIQFLIVYFLIVTLLTTILIGIYKNNLFYVLIYFTGLFLSYIYSAPPIRLKEKGFIGLLAVPILEYIIPALLIFSYLSYYEIDVLAIIGFYFFFSLLLILEHQLKDFKSDKISKINTFAVKIGMIKSIKILNLLVYLTILSLIPLIILFYLKISFFILFILLLIIINFLHLKLTKLKKIKKWFLPRWFNFFIKMGLLIYFPLFLSISIIFSFPTYLIILTFTIICYYKSLTKSFKIFFR